MKLSPSLAMLPVALGIGFLAGRQGGPELAKETKTEQRNTRESRTASRGSRSDPFGGASFSRDAGLKAVAEAWSQYDAIATANWLGTLEAGSSRDAAIEPLVDRIRETDPNTAFSWAASITDENDRLNQLRQTLKSWRGSDLQAARVAFDSANLSSKERDSLAKELQ